MFMTVYAKQLALGVRFEQFDYSVAPTCAYISTVVAHCYLRRNKPRRAGLRKLDSLELFAL